MPTTDFETTKRRESCLSRCAGAIAASPGDNNASEMARAAFSFVDVENCVDQLFPDSELVGYPVVQVWLIALSVYGGILWGRCMANLHTEAMVYDSCNYFMKEVS